MVETFPKQLYVWYDDDTMVPSCNLQDFSYSNTKAKIGIYKLDRVATAVNETRIVDAKPKRKTKGKSK